MKIIDLLFRDDNSIVRVSQIRSFIDVLFGEDEVKNAFNSSFETIAQNIHIRGLYADMPEATGEYANFLYLVIPAVTPDPATDNTAWFCDGTQWIQIGSSGGGANLSIGAITATTIDIESDSGTDATIPSATTTDAGLMSAADKVALDNVLISHRLYMYYNY